MSEAEPTETIHLYIVKEEEEHPIVDSTGHDATKTATQPFVWQSYPMKLQLVPYLIMAAHLLIVLAAFSVHFYTILTETATITIIPKSYRLTEHLTLSNVQSRIFQPIILKQSRTVAATGKGHQDATAATGTITLYNAAVTPQTIDAGTLLIGSDGVHIVTDQLAYIPGATPPIEGQTTVSVHAVNPGAAGNIQAGDISGACCRENIFAYNNAFQGGADERDYSVVTQQDIHSVVSALVPHLTESIQATFQKQVQPGEVLTPNQCSQKISTDRNAGDEATQVTITISESCLGGAYNTGDLQAKIRQALAQRATQTIGKGYLLSTYAPISPMKVRIQQGTLVMTVILQGTMIYQFSQQDLQNLRRQIAGKTKQQAGAILSHIRGIERVFLKVKGTNEKLPINAANITFLFVVGNQ